MQRTIKYGLTGVLLAGMIGATVAFSSSDRVIHLVVDGQPRTVTTEASTVAGVLRQAGYHLTARDLVAPAPSAAVHDGSRIVLQQARELHLDVDGKQTTVWTTAPTVAAALAQLGYSADDLVSVSRSTRLPLSPTDLAVRTPRQVTVVHDGQRQQVTTTALTVAQLFDQLGITLHADDRVAPALPSEVRPGSVIRLVRIENRQVSKVRTVPAPVKRVDDPHLSVGSTVVVRPGHPGTQRVTWTAVYINGRLSAREKPTVTTIEPAGTKVLRVGTGIPAEATPAQAQAYARSLLPSFGWGDDQMSCLVTMWNHESGWNLHAENPGSGAYGIPQALPGDKMGPGWDSDAGVQVRWGLQYIKSRYNSPCEAWSFWQQGSWY